MLSPARTSAAGAAELTTASASRFTSETWAIIALTLVAAALRFATLGAQSFWFDEAQLAHETQLSFGAMLHTLGAQETSPPLYFTLAWLWEKLFGAGAAGLRSLSALAGVAVVPLTYLAGRELVGKRAGSVAAALAALCPFMIYYSQEAREYMLLAALCAASLWFFARALHAPSRLNLGWWAGFSALALLTHFFAGFLVGAEALWLLASHRSRAVVMACAALVAVHAALLPLLIRDTSHPVGWISALPLSIRIRQVPVAFAFATLDKSSMIRWGLLGAAVLTAVLIVLLIVGADRTELRGAGIAASLAGFVLIVPLLLALLGSDYYIARALIPAWIPLAVLVGAACATRRAQTGGAVLAVLLVSAFVGAWIRISDNSIYQRPDWRAVAASLGVPRTARAILVYEGSLAAGPLSFYLRGVPWVGNDASAPAGPNPVTVGELDVVGNVGQAPVPEAAEGIRLIATRAVDGYEVARFVLRRPWHMSPVALAKRAGALLAPPSGPPVVLVQRLQ
jgi:4-amino-4-deoxy-L-arabinose transferase-like glycosyltransferase